MSKHNKNKIDPQAQRWTLTAAILVSGSVFLDTSVINVALPAIDQELHAGFSGLQWVVDGYLLTLSALLILGGALGDRIGRRRIMLIGLVGFGSTLALCGMAPSMEWLIAARVLQGAAGALLVPGSLALIRSVYSDPEERGSAIGTWSGWSGITTVIGPLIGGWLTGALSWRWIFFINVPLIAFTGWLMYKFVPESRRPDTSEPLDVGGAILITLGLAGIAYGLIEGPVVGWNHPAVIVMLAGGVLALLIFPWIESRVSNPMVPLEMFRSSDFSGANLTTLGVYAALQGTTFLLVIYLQNIIGLSPLQSGLMLAPISLLLLVISPWVGQLAGQYGARIFMTIGPFVCAVGLGLLNFIEPDASIWSELLPIISIFGLGLAITVAPLTNTVISAVSEQHSGIAAAFNNMVSRVAGLLAIGVLGVIVASTFNATMHKQIEVASLTPQMIEQLNKMAENPTSGANLDRLSQLAADIYKDAFTRSLHRSMSVSAGLAALGGIVAFVTIQPHPGDPLELN